MVPDLNFTVHNDPIMNEDKDMEEVLDEIFEWQKETFPHATPQSCYNHLKKEIAELGENLNDPSEIADCIMLLSNMAKLQGIDVKQVIKEKFAINKTRTWGKVNSEGFVEHVKDKAFREPSKACHEVATFIQNKTTAAGIHE